MLPVGGALHLPRREHPEQESQVPRAKQPPRREARSRLHGWEVG